ncbi:uncharacterized protein [Macrobrachium rosenbergii]|uniref:uncharacterized protein n=1 Tax=Macrobrachium rosenbergii TaxID=79674 RepID=UPI0034D59B92
MIDRVYSKYPEWFSAPLFRKDVIDVIDSKIQENASANPQITLQSKGRPSGPYESLTDRSKRRITSDIRKDFTPDQLLDATSTSLWTSHEPKKAKIVKAVSLSSPNTLRKLDNAILRKETTMAQYSAEEALALIIDLYLGIEAYRTLRQGALHHGFDLYPSYHEVLKAKSQTYPLNIFVNEMECSVRLQEILDLTAKRILMTYEEDILKKVSKFTIVSKYGMDGSTGYSKYKQRSEEEIDEDNLFLISFIPIRLEGVSEEKTIVIWTNPRPSSTRLCRPIKLLFKKETTELIKVEAGLLEKEVDALTDSSIRLYDLNFRVSHKMFFSMIDGKVMQVIGNIKSSQVCVICQAKPTEMNDLNRVQNREINHEMLKYGLSPLHAYIRFYECILLISYRLDFKKWRASGDNRRKLEEEKKRVQRELRTELGLIVDIPCPGGSGTSNDGNSARRFFDEYEISSRITRVDSTLLKRLGVILKVINTNFEIDSEKFNQYAQETAQLYVEKYPWFYMPKSMHQILIHGGDVISYLLVPIGSLSEEAQETRNKDNKRLRIYHTRKTSRISGNEDLMHGLLASSDPCIVGLRKEPKTNKSSSFSSEVLSLLKEYTWQDEEL